MMQDGLHIGLAAWIDEQRNAGGFAVYPAMPIPTSLAALEAIKDANDVARAAEFARLTNFIPRQGQVADVFSASAVLWDVHRDVLGRMDFAAEPWTSAERAQYQAARGVLYASDAAGRPVPSEQFLLYEEMKRAYQDLQASGGEAAELAQALANWVVLGHKQAIEDALEAIIRLLSRSTRGQAQDERAQLEPSRLLVSGDLSFAPTYFAPISAMAREAWMEARVTFDDLDRAVGDGPASGKWKAYLANRQGEVLFDYVVISCLRPWYTPSLYEADDWRLGGGGAAVSQGNGADGLLPAFVDAVYLTCVKNVTIRPMAPRPMPPIRVPRLPPRVELLSAVRRDVSRPILRPELAADANPGPGVVMTAMSAPVAATARLAEVEPSAALRVGRVLSAGDPPTASVRSGALRRLADFAPSRRFTMVQGYVAGQTQSPTPAPEAPAIYVAGFGCQKVPFAPNPNPSYGWS